jgi:hypothetical protein
MQIGRTSIARQDNAWPDTVHSSDSEFNLR